jgi:NADH-ubiquinone oxidoreductase chain 1
MKFLKLLFFSLPYCLRGLSIFPYQEFALTTFVFVSFLFIWFRGTMPRFRYKLMYLAWRSFFASFIKLPFIFYWGLGVLFFLYYSILI